MKYLFHALIAVMLSLVATACSISELAEVEPSQWEKHDFENKVARSVRKAVNAPGIDNGSTLIVTTTGDTLVSPTDSAFAAAPLRTVYVDIQAPVYPKRYSQNTLQFLSVISIVGSVSLIILIILLGIFIVTVRRQHGRNKIINHAIADNYTLPESYFTGQPQQAPVTINNVTSYIPHPAVEQQNNTPDPSQEPPSFNNEATVNGNPPIDASNVGNFLRNCGINDTPQRLKKFRNAVVIIGFGIITFFAFAFNRAPSFGIFVGGVCVLLGLAQLLTLFLSKKF